MRRAWILAFSLGMMANMLFGYEIFVGSIETNAGARVSLPVTMSSAKGLAYASVRITYDPQVMELVGTKEGTLGASVADDFVVITNGTDGCVAIAAFGTTNVMSDAAGTLATLMFAVREGTEGMMSDVTIASVEVGDVSGVRDVTIDEGITIANGLVQISESVMSDDLQVAVAEGVNENLSKESIVQIRSNIALSSAASNLIGATSIAIQGPDGLIGMIADMGIAPRFVSVDSVGIAQFSYERPTIKITEFDHTTGQVRIKVEPGDGNEIVSEIATGYVHVYGTSDLGKAMEKISQVEFDLTPYLESSSKGEADLTVEFGSHSFIQIKVESK